MEDVAIEMDFGGQEEVDTKVCRPDVIAVRFSGNGPSRACDVYTTHLGIIRGVRPDVVRGVLGDEWVAYLTLVPRCGGEYKAALSLKNWALFVFHSREHGVLAA
jgi:hypothetical protein